VNGFKVTGKVRNNSLDSGPTPPPGTCLKLTPGIHHYVAVPVSVYVAVSVKTVSIPAVRMPLLPGRVRCNSAAGPGGRPPSFPRKSGRSSRRVWTACTEK